MFGKLINILVICTFLMGVLGLYKDYNMMKLNIDIGTEYYWETGSVDGKVFRAFLKCEGDGENGFLVYSGLPQSPRRCMPIEYCYAMDGTPLIDFLVDDGMSTKVKGRKQRYEEVVF